MATKGVTFVFRVYEVSWEFWEDSGMGFPTPDHGLDWSMRGGCIHYHEVAHDEHA